MIISRSYEVDMLELSASYVEAINQVQRCLAG